MLGPGLQFNRSRHGEDRFYSAATARLRRDNLRRAHSDATPSHSRCRPDKSNPEIPSSPEVSEPSPMCNLERFFISVTPSVPAQHLSKMKVRSWRTCDVESHPFFVLSDLWESFKEWSVYGVGVPLILNDRDGVVQYYVPYLSGIQLYADLSKSTTKSRQLGEESDESSDSDLERGCTDYPREQLNYLQRSDFCLTVKEQQMAFQEGFSSDEGESESSQGFLLFEYLEHDRPYSREPLSNKISDLALHCPELKTLRSCDLLPSSWISVAWYPIYRIPNGPTLRDLDVCFLTFHSLHTPMTGSEGMVGERDGVGEISIPVFGLASYKYKESVWSGNAGEQQQQLPNSLLQAADRWLKLHAVTLPDYCFFCRR